VDRIRGLRGVNSCAERDVSLQGLTILPEGVIRLSPLQESRMKFVPILLLIAAAGWLGRVALRAQAPTYSQADLAEVPHALSSSAPSGYADVTIEVEGMCGPCCERTLFDKARAVDGVAGVAVSFEEEAVHVRLAEGGDLQPVLDALTTDQHTPVVRR
jgi:hypothetical protein